MSRSELRGHEALYLADRMGAAGLLVDELEALIDRLDASRGVVGSVAAHSPESAVAVAQAKYALKEAREDALERWARYAMAWARHNFGLGAEGAE